MRNVTVDERRAVLAIANALPDEQGHQVKADLEISQVEEENGLSSPPVRYPRIRAATV